MRTPALVVAALLASATLAGPVRASQVMPQAKPLAEVVAQADTIVVVELSKAKGRAIKVPMSGGGEPFVRNQSPYVVSQVLRGDSKLVGQTIYVDVYDWQFNKAMVETIRQHGPTPSKIVPSYKRLSDKPIPDAAPRILFLRKQADGAYEPAVMDAVESVKHLDQIKAQIETLAKPPAKAAPAP